MMKNYLSLVKFSHTIFAMPFALVGFFLATKMQGEGVSLQKLMLVLLCMVFARTAAMAFNRYLDRDIDASNPRTQVREIPAGVISPKAALGFVILNMIAFMSSAFFINRLCFWLSPVALAVILGYSYTKRFTALCHLILGVGLGLAPVGAFLAVTGYFHWIPVCYGMAMMLWVAGFDIIYALQDAEFDRSQGLHSIPSYLGRARALKVSEWLHLGTAVLMVAAARLCYSTLPEVGWLLWIGTGVFLLLLGYQHRLVKADDLSRVNMAFFTTNGIASLFFGSLVIFDLFT